MNRIMTSVLLILGLYILVGGQENPSSNRERVREQIIREDAARQRREARQMQAARQMGTDDAGLDQIKTNRILDKIKNTYREPNTEEMKFLSPEREDLDRFAEFLSQKNTGLIKLLPDIGCAKNPYIFVVSEDCLKYSMPGAGSSYSFRKETYRIPNLADLTIKGKFFVTTGGMLIQGILVNIGDVQLETVNNQTAGFGFIANFKPETNSVKAREVSDKLADGIKNDGLLYQSTLPIKNNSTYLLRSIAYKGFIQRSVDSFIYDESRWDERKDVLVVFRVVRQNTDGSVTILWKSLLKKNAPKMDI